MPIPHQKKLAADDRVRLETRLPVAATIKLPLPLLCLRIGEDPNRKNHHIEAGELKFLLQCCGRVIVQETAQRILFLKNQLAGKKD